MAAVHISSPSSVTVCVWLSDRSSSRRLVDLHAPRVDGSRRSSPSLVVFVEDPFEGVNEAAHNGELGFQTREAACPFRRRDLLLQLPAFLLEECEIAAELGEPLVDFGFGAHACSVACGAGKHAGGARPGARFDNPPHLSPARAAADPCSSCSTVHLHVARGEAGTATICQQP